MCKKVCIYMSKYVKICRIIKTYKQLQSFAHKNFFSSNKKNIKKLKKVKKHWDLLKNI